MWSEQTGSIFLSMWYIFKVVWIWVNQNMQQDPKVIFCILLHNNSEKLICLSTKHHVFPSSLRDFGSEWSWKLIFYHCWLLYEKKPKSTIDPFAICQLILITFIIKSWVVCVSVNTVCAKQAAENNSNSRVSQWLQSKSPHFLRNKTISKHTSQIILNAIQLFQYRLSPTTQSE